MTRKRYVKLLMALGMDRNEANAAACLCRATGKTYAADYKASAPWMRLHMAARRVKKAFEKIGRTAAATLTAWAIEFNRNMHHAGHPITMQIVTREEHAAIHGHDGYRAAITLADELATAGGGKV